jgi:hypothetical protein
VSHLLACPLLVAASLLGGVAHAAGTVPTAEAGLGLVGYVGDTIELNGSASTDPDGEPLTYTWTQLSGPTVEMTGADKALPRFEITEPGTLQFQLVVNDSTLDSLPDTVDVVVPWRDIPSTESGCASAPAGASGRGVGLAVAGAVAVGLVARRRSGGAPSTLPRHPRTRG